MALEGQSRICKQLNPSTAIAVRAGLLLGSGGLGNSRSQMNWLFGFPWLPSSNLGAQVLGVFGGIT